MASAPKHSVVDAIRNQSQTVVSETNPPSKKARTISSFFTDRIDPTSLDQHISTLHSKLAEEIKKQNERQVIIRLKNKTYRKETRGRKRKTIAATDILMDARKSIPVDGHEEAAIKLLCESDVGQRKRKHNWVTNNFFIFCFIFT